MRMAYRVENHIPQKESSKGNSIKYTKFIDSGAKLYFT